MMCFEIRYEFFLIFGITSKICILAKNTKINHDGRGKGQRRAV